MPASPLRVASPPTGRPLLLWDGDCRFCRLWADRWREEYGARVDFAPARSQAGRFPEIPAAAFDEAVQFVTPDGRVFAGAAALLHARAHGTGRPGLLGRIYARVPGGAWLLEAAYRLVARRRGRLYALTRAVCGPSLAPLSYSFGPALFIRALAVIYALAFASLWWQLPGLIGPEGLLPAQPFLDAEARQLGAARWWELPTLSWIFGGGAFLHVLCGGGLLLSGALFARLAPPLCLLLLWAAYLSLVVAGQEFLGFQWDLLLLETGLLTVLLVPWRWRAPARFEPPRIARWLLGWLLFRLMFMSAYVKLASGDPTWRDLTALTHHYQTQPLPTWLGWWMHQLPAGVQRASCAAMFLVEFTAPFLLFGPRRLRRLGALALAGLQLVIAATGNYTFFNLLTIALCLPLLDDAWWARGFGVAPRPQAESAGERRPAGPARRAAAALLLAASLVITLPGLLREVDWPGWYASAYRAVALTRSVNRYGLFAVMTTRRPEIVIEGSRDGRTWIPYEFRWKAGDLRRAPGWVAPHQPRLDWQMWFAALGHPRQEPWMAALFRGLARNSPPILRLLAANPFPDQPPAYLRAIVYDYAFTTPAELRRTGAWWRRTAVDYHLPPTRVP
ncbi:MAG: lipase maturation factor family protein [Opitutaceae bacterium]|nr:lipase maturation factor family protein [Opitutaceae bacterium]